ncbi:MAG: 4'-phosphopantetheinyl transferase superfamily protein, partial [Tannerella sp.]|nr:4'-phosphopantetheinyl transferase superfamily protein [Tannerella sp.]
MIEQHNVPLWGVWKIDETWNELLQLFENPGAYARFLAQFKYDGRKAEWLAVRILLKQLLNEEATIAYYETGIPYLPNHPFHISISHTKGHAAVMLDKNKPVGIDIEYHSERIHRIKSRFMNDTELASFSYLNTEQLLVCWSAKETAFKAMQQRVVDLQTNIHIISFQDNGNRGMLTLKETFTQMQANYRVEYRIAPEFVLTYSL